MTTTHQSSTLNKGIAVIHANKLESLLDVVTYWLSEHPLAPLEQEVFLVNNSGMAQWLKQNLAQNSALGIAASLDVKLPSSFIWQVYRAVLADKISKEQLLARQTLVWRLYRLLPIISVSAGFDVLQQFLANDTQERKRYQLAEQLADLYDQYQVYRADWLSDWAMGQDVLRDAHGEVQKLPDSQRWQALLWRLLLADVGHDNDLIMSRAAVHAEFMAQIDNAQPQLPKRVIVFGLSSLPQQALEVLAKISQFCQVVLFVHNPCQHYWADIIEDKELLKAERQRQAYKSGMSADLSLADLHQHANPLLAAWGKQGRDYLRLLDLFDEKSAYESWGWPDHKIDLFEDYGDNAAQRSLLQQVQQAILDLEPLPETPNPIANIDESLVFHIAHSPQREVEILHDQLLARFNADPTLHPRDIIIMVPDINTYAPHIRAVFGQLDKDDKRFIPFSLADQQQRGQNPLLNAVEVLLNLPDSRFEVSEFLGLLEVPALRKKFSLEESAIPKLHQWLKESGIRWGIDSEQRKSAVAMPTELTANTWQFGLQRLLLGYAVGAGQSFNGIEPYANIGGLEAQYLGGLASLQELLAAYVIKLRQAHSVADWVQLLIALLDDFFVSTQEREHKTLVTLTQALEQWQANCAQAKCTDEVLIPINIVKETWLTAVDEPNLQQRFLSGRVNFCTLMPMRAIPFKVVCLLGINDGEFPRTQQIKSFDLMGQRGHYRPGDRSRRQDDHYLFLEAVMSAREQLYISWVGHSIRDNTEIPPSVFVSQLREFIAQSYGLDLAAIPVAHPLQPFSINYLKTNIDPRLYTYSKEWFETDIDKRGVSALKTARVELPKVISIDTLARFLKAPVKTFCQETLKIRFEDDNNISEDNEPFGFNHLESYQHTDALLTELKENPTLSLETVFTERYQTLKATGSLPLAGFAKLTFDGLTEAVTGAWSQYQELLTSGFTEIAPQSISLDLCLDTQEHLQLTGNLTNLYQHPTGQLAFITVTAQTLCVNTSKQIKYHTVINIWLTHVVACAAGLNCVTYGVGADAMIQLDAIPTQEAQTILEQLAAAWYLGLQNPLPVAIKSAFAWLPKRDLAMAQKQYEGDDWNAGEVVYDLYLRRFFPEFTVLEAGFTEWAERLYAPAFAQIQLVKGAQ